MSRGIFLLFFGYSFSIRSAQINAITDAGEGVIFYEDGSWEYVNKGNSITSEIFENPGKFER